MGELKSFATESTPILIGRPRQKPRQFCQICRGKLATMGAVGIGLASLIIVVVYVLNNQSKTSESGQLESVGLLKSSLRDSPVQSKRSESVDSGFGDISQEFLEIPLGKLGWSILESRENRPYFAFYKVPFAKPPIGEFRFQPPEEDLVGWEDVRNFTEVAPQCIQKVKYSEVDEASGEEDCLYLNIYTPMIPGVNAPNNTELLPTMFYIHGGGFADGNGSRYGGKYFMDQNVVLITFQYRLGIFGFLSSEDGVVQGNMGMKDQVQALKWTRKNIQYFGGDPNKITIFGNSAGAISVNQFMVSHMTTGLFERAITQSGPMLSLRGIKDTQLASFYALAEAAGCLGDYDSSNIMTCLQGIPADTLAVLRPPGATFVQTIEQYPHPNCPDDDPLGNFENCPKFLDEDPLESLLLGKTHPVPWILGIVSDEWLGMAVGVMLQDDLVDKLNENWSECYAELFQGPTNCTQNFTTIADESRSFYFGSEMIDDHVVNNMSDLISDRDINYPTFTVGFIHAQTNPVYLYRMSKRPRKSYADKFLAGTRFENITFGGSHADELQYLFNYAGYPEYLPDDPPFFQFSKTVVEMWADFANTGVPTEDWKQLKPDEQPFSWFQLDDEMTPTTAMQERIEFWRQFSNQDLCYY